MGNMAAAILLTAGLVLAQGGGVVHQEDLAPPGEMVPEREESQRETPAPFVEAEPVEEEKAPEPSEPPEDPDPRDEPETRPQPRPQPRRSVPAFWFVLPN